MFRDAFAVDVTLFDHQTAYYTCMYSSLSHQSVPTAHTARGSPVNATAKAAMPVVRVAIAE